MIDSTIFKDFDNLPIRVTPSGLYSVYDAIRLCGKNPYTTWKTLLSHERDYSSVRTCQWFKFPGKGQRKTPVNNQKNIIKILELTDSKKRKEYANNYKELPTAEEIWLYLEICGDKEFSAFYGEFYDALSSSEAYRQAGDIKYDKELSKTEKLELLLEDPQWGLAVNLAGDCDFDYESFFDLMGYSDYWQTISPSISVMKSSSKDILNFFKCETAISISQPTT